jgi:hypothetical protein
MSLPPDTDTTNQQLIELTIDTDAVMAAAAAADAILCDPAPEEGKSEDGQMQISMRSPPFSTIVSLTLDLPLCALMFGEGLAWRHSEANDSPIRVRKYRCIRCNRDVSKVKTTRGTGTNQACHPECRPKKHQLDECAATEERPAKKHRRSKSDPGQPQQQQLPIASSRLRVRAPKPPPLAPNLRPVKPCIDPMALLDAAHARRIALMEAEKNGTGSSAPNASAVVWQ